MRVATFHGAVDCRRDPGAPLAVTLSGPSIEHPDEPLSLGFAAVAVPELPAVLTDPLIEHDGGDAYRIVTAGGTWRIAARAVHLHREVGRSFYQAIPPRPVPRVRRALWRTVLAFAASRVGVAALRALRH